MQEITFLFGAGASANCIPVVAGMSSGIDDTKRWFETKFIELKGKNLIDEEKQKHYDNVLKDLNWLTYVCDVEKNFSVDTFAKKLRISENFDEYNRLKNALTVFFTLRQKHKPLDVRYDNFWASLVNKKYVFPDNIRILSWNYDFQLELSYQGFVGSKSLKEAATSLNIITHKTNQSGYKGNSKFTIFKLNGSATYNSEVVKNANNYIIDDIRNVDIKDIIFEIFRYRSTVSNDMINFENHLSYAWEHDRESPFYSHLEKSIRETRILVVIGYSFPFFNREVDKWLFKDKMPHLSKVYFQAPEKDVNNIKERFLAIRDDIAARDLVNRVDTSQFVFPNEM